MLKNILNLEGAKIISKNKQKDVKGGQPAGRACGVNFPPCPPGWCCGEGNVCIDDTPIGGVTPPCIPIYP